MINYLYKIYGMVVVSNVKMPLLNEISCLKKQDEGVLVLTVRYGVVINNGISIIQDESGCVIIKLNNYANYIIDIHSNKITCFANDFESFFSTLFNLPFSIYLLFNRKLLFHACGISIGSKIVGLTGDKGVGKSTLSYLITGEELHLYSDDTFLIQHDNTVERAHNLIKMTDETIGKLDVQNVLSTKNATGKSYSYIEQDNKSTKVLNSIVQIKRSDNNIINITNITSAMIKKTVFFHNIVGINYFEKNLFKTLINMNIPNDIPCYYLYIPNNLEALIKYKKEIITIIKGVIV